MEKETGIVTKWFADRGFGFIRPDADPREELFVHWREIGETGEFRELRVGDEVEFELGTNARGPVAVSVEVVEGAAA